MEKICGMDWLSNEQVNSASACFAGQFFFLNKQHVIALGTQPIVLCQRHSAHKTKILKYMRTSSQFSI